MYIQSVWYYHPNLLLFFLGQEHLLELPKQHNHQTPPIYMNYGTHLFIRSIPNYLVTMI